MPEISLTVNGEQITKSVEGRTLLVEFIRETLKLTGTHIGCDTSQCGACTVHLNGQAVKSCTMLAAQAGLQCGFCTPGMVMRAMTLVKDNPNPTEAEVRHGLEGNICRCTGYQNIVAAVLDGAKALRG